MQLRKAFQKVVLVLGFLCLGQALLFAVDISYLDTGTGKGVDMITGPDGSLHAVYEKELNVGAYSIRTGGSWVVQATPPSTGDRQYLAVHSSGPAFLGTYRSSVGLFSYSASTWSSNLYYSPFNSLLGLDLDPSGNPILLLGGSGLKVTGYDGSSWVDTALPGTTSNTYGSLKIDSAGHVHVAYTNSSGVLMYGKYDGSTWSTHLFSGYTPAGLDMVLDSEGNPHIAFYGSDLTLQYASLNGSWTVMELEAEAGSPVSTSYLSLAMDGQDRAYISYCDLDSQGLDLKYFDGSSWQNTPIYSQLVYGNTVTVDENGNPVILFVTGTGQVLVAENVPEPRTFLLVAAGFCLFFFFRKRLSKTV